MIPERERPWVTRWVPQMLAAKRISADLTDSLSGAHPTTPRRSLPHTGTFKMNAVEGRCPSICWRTNT
jgi:hypothetical protein